MKKHVTVNKDLQKWLWYSGFIFISFLAQGLPFFPPINGVVPNLMLVLPICIAMYEGPFAGGICGAACGAIFDTLHGGIAGFFPCMLLLFCAVIGALCLSVFRATVISAVTLGSIAVFLIKAFEWFCFSSLMGEQNASFSFMHYTLPNWIYTSVFIAPTFYITVWIKNKYDHLSV